MPLIWNKATFDAQYSVRAWPWGIRNYYRCPALHYHWAVQNPRIIKEMDALLTMPGWAQLSHVAIMGGGFGWSAEYLTSQGIEALCIDTSSYVNDNVAVSEETEIRDAADTDPVLLADGYGPGNNFFDTFAGFVDPTDTNAVLAPGAIWSHLLHPSGGRSSLEVINEDISTNSSRNRVRNKFSGNLDAILSEFALDSFEIADDAGRIALLDAMETLQPNPACQLVHLIQPNPAETVMLLGDLTFWRGWLDARGYTSHIVANVHGAWL